MTLFYPDCSNNNWSSTQDAINFLEQLVPESFSGICHKVSEGSYYEDPNWPAVQQWCRNNNLPVIGYHYVTTDDDAAQARTWTANNGGPVAMLDWEANGGDLANLTAVVDAFNTAGSQDPDNRPDQRCCAARCTSSRTRLIQSCSVSGLPRSSAFNFHVISAARASSSS